jgi:hypothetical protein
MYSGTGSFGVHQAGRVDFPARMRSAAQNAAPEVLCVTGAPNVCGDFEVIPNVSLNVAAHERPERLRHSI